MNSLNFIEMVLGFDPEQKIMIVLGFLYHDLLLNALSVIPPQASTSAIGGLKELTMTLGMIGTLVLILNRSLWNVKTIVSWLIIMLLVTLGGRGDVLYTNLTNVGVVTTQTTLGAPQSPAGTLQTSYLAASAAPKQNNIITINQAQQSGDSQPPPTTATFPTYGQHIMQQLKDLPNVTNETQIGGFTPIVVTLYAFNRLNLLLLTTLKISAIDEIAKRMERVPDIMFGNIVSPSAKAMVDTYVQVCGNASNLKLDQQMLEQKMAPNSSRTVWDTLKSQNFDYNDLVAANNAYFASTDPNIQTYTFPFFANDKDLQNYSTLNKDAKDFLVVHVPDDDAPHDTPEIARLVEAELNRRSGGALAPNYNLGMIANTNLSSSVGLDMQKPITLVTVAPQVENEFDAENGEIKNSIFSGKCAPLISVTGAIGGGVAAVGNAVSAARLSLGECKEASDTLSFNNCADLHAETHKRLIAATSKRQLEKDLMQSLVEKAIQSGIRNGRNEIVADVAGLSDEQLLLYAVREYEMAKLAACGASGQGAGAAWEAFRSTWLGGQSSTCDDTDENLAMLQKMLQAKAIRGTTTFYEQLYKSSYDPSSLFISDLRKFASDAGALLGPVVLWFGALFGGFGAGSYGGIVPHFMAFIIGFMIAVAPLMFVVGLVMPGWAFGILLTPVGIVAYMKMVEVMFTVVTSIFTMFKPAVTSDWVAITAENEGLVNLQTAIYDIVVGLSYTSMFGVAGYVMFSMGNPGALMGAMKSIDSQAKIEFKDVLAAGAAVKGGIALAKNTAALPFAAADTVGRGIGVAKKGVEVIASEGLIGGAAKLANATVGSLKGSVRQGEMSLQGKLDKADQDDTAYTTMREEGHLPGHSKQITELSRRADRRGAADKKFKNAAKNAGMDKRNTSEPKFKDENGVLYEGAAPVDLLVGKLAAAIQKTDGLNVEQAEIKAHNIIVESQDKSKKAMDAELASKPNATEDEKKEIRERHALLDGGAIDRENKKVQVEFNPNAGGVGEYLKKYNIAATDLGQDLGNGRVMMSGDMKTAGAGKGVKVASNTSRQSAAVGQNPSAGRRKFTEEEVKEAIEKADKNGWDLEPKK